MSIETEEIVQTIERLQGAFEDLTVRGLRSVGPQDLALLRSVHDEFERIGAGHLAGRIAEVLRAVDSNDRSAAEALLRAQASLRVFERVLTLEAVGQTLQEMLAAADGDES